MAVLVTLGNAAGNTLTFMVIALPLVAPALIFVGVLQLTVVGIVGELLLQVQFVPAGGGAASVKPAGNVSVMV